MKDSNHLINQVTQEIEASSKTSPIEAGQAERKKSVTDAHIDVVNEVFTLFRINYHNQYYKAYSDTSVLNQIKKLWLESLLRFEPETISRGARKVIEESEYLPTLNRMMTACQGVPQDFGLKDVHSAYIEACHAASPKTAFNWSHPAVYHAGCASDWFFLASNSEKVTFPIFKQHYLRICAEVMNGDELLSPKIQALPQTIETPLSKEENLERMNELRKELNI